jgi:hypothetical protein
MFINTLTPMSSIKLGRADESFRMHELDQGLHILLPGMEHLPNGTRVEVNGEFKPLFEEYFNRIPRYDDLTRIQKLFLISDEEDGYCELYCGAIERWLTDQEIVIERQWLRHYDTFIKFLEATTEEETKDDDLLVQVTLKVKKGVPVDTGLDAAKILVDNLKDTLRLAEDDPILGKLDPDAIEYAVL